MKPHVIVNDAKVYDIQFGSVTVASALVMKYKDGVLLFRLFTAPEHRRRGYATEIILTVIEQYDLPIYLVPKSFGEQGMTDAELFDWYSTFDFKPCGKMLRREPCKTDTFSPRQD